MAVWGHVAVSRQMAIKCDATCNSLVTAKGHAAGKYYVTIRNCVTARSHVAETGIKINKHQDNFQISDIIQ